MVLFTVYSIKPGLRNVALLIFSLLFYAWGEPQYIFLMLFSIAFNYILGILIERFEEKNAIRKYLLIAAIIINLAILGYYKYSPFLIENINSLFGLSIAMDPLPLPIGISFYTFQAMSYIIDIYRRNGYVQKNPINLALYIAIFPALTAWSRLFGITILWIS